jgi:hypothetical protein
MASISCVKCSKWEKAQVAGGSTISFRIHLRGQSNRNRLTSSEWAIISLASGFGIKEHQRTSHNSRGNTVPDDSAHWAHSARVIQWAKKEGLEHDCFSPQNNVRPSCADLAEDFFFKVGEADLGFCVSQLSLDGIHLRVECDYLIFGGHVSGNRAEAALDETFEFCKASVEALEGFFLAI